MLWPTELSEHIKQALTQVCVHTLSHLIGRLPTCSIVLIYLKTMKKQLIFTTCPFGLVAGVRFELRLWVMGPACFHCTTPAKYIKDIQTLWNSFITTSGIVSTCYSSHLKAFWVCYGFR